MTDYVGEADLDDLIHELAGPADLEHPDVAVAVESGWTLSAFATGLVVSENVEGRYPVRHMTGLSRQEMRALFSLLVRGDWARIETLGWQSGDGA